MPILKGHISLLEPVYAYLVYVLDLDKQKKLLTRAQVPVISSLRIVLGNEGMMFILGSKPLAGVAARCSSSSRPRDRTAKHFL